MSRDGSREIATICSASSASPSSSPPLKVSSWVSRLNVAIAFAAVAASPRTNVSAVGPSRRDFSDSTPASSAARSVSVFLTTRKLASASRSRVRTSAACGTEMPRKSTAKTASDSLIWATISAIAAAFCSRFMGLLVGTSGGVHAARPRSSVARSRLRGGGRSLLEDVAGPARVDLDARPHRGGERDRADVPALRGRRPRTDDLVEDGRVVLGQRAVLEAGLADGQVDDRGAVGAVLDLAGLGLLDRLADVHRDRADLRVGHLALRAEDAAEAADDGHHVGRRDG